MRNDIRINEEFKNLIPPLSEEEYQQLTNNILKYGIREPLAVWNGYLVDGHHRYEIATENELDFDTVEYDFENEDEAKVWMVQNQLGRRNLSPYERSKLALALKEQVKQKGTPNVRKSLADIADVSENTIQRVEYIENNADDETKEKLQNREISINKAFEQTREAELSDETSPSVSKPHITNSTGNNEWYTPSNIVECARKVFGHIDIDPASNDTAQDWIQADTYYTVQTDGLIQDWKGKVWLNPPYATDLIGKFISKLNQEVENGNTEEAIVLVNNATETIWFKALLENAKCVCFPYGRVKFVTPDGSSGSPLQGQAIVYIGNNAKAFANEFKEIGWIGRVLHR